MLLWPNRLFASGHVLVAAGVPSILASAGPVTGVVDNGVGSYIVTFRAPGVLGFATGRASLFVTPISATFAAATATLGSATALGIQTFDAAGAALDVSVAFAVFNLARVGVVT